jgi:CRP-like cAMP-binding protein
VPQRGSGPLRLLSFGPGLTFGEMALLDGQRRSADAVADTDGEVAQLSRAGFDDLAVADPPLYAAVTRGLALLLVGRLRDTNRLLQERG